jgi:cyclopropane-fatty-acyl-phospholipid synthase
LRSEDGAAALLHSRHAIELLFGPPSRRRFAVRYWDGTREEPGTKAQFTLVIRRPSALRDMLLPPTELSIVESYLTGAVDVEGDLGAAAALGDAITSRIAAPSTLVRLVRDVLALPKGGDARHALQTRRADRTVAPAGHEHDPARDQAAIHYHYDVGNDFYRLWLDERMVYSCAYFARPDFTLEQAQEAKLDLVCRKLRLRPGERLLDVGCGWGALVMHAAKHYGVHAVGITLSTQQVELARDRIAAAGLEGQCHVEIRDYRDAPRLGPFDKVASIGMVEHVGVDKLPEYFAAVRAALKPGGLFLNHGIVSVDAARDQPLRDRVEGRLLRRGSFIEQYVFPDGRLGPFRAIIDGAEQQGFETRDVESLREHYVLTLREWVRRLERCEREAVALVGEQTYRVWRLYMTASANQFAAGHLNVLQTLLANPRAGRSMLPMTREDVYGLTSWTPAQG